MQSKKIAMLVPDGHNEEYRFPEENDLWVYEFCEKVYRVMTYIDDLVASFRPKSDSQVSIAQLMDSDFMSSFEHAFSGLPKSLQRKVFAKIPSELFRHFSLSPVVSPDHFSSQALQLRLLEAREILLKFCDSAPVDGIGPVETLSFALDQESYFRKVDQLLYAYSILFREVAGISCDDQVGEFGDAEDVQAFVRSVERELSPDDPLRFLMWLYLMPEAEFDQEAYPFFLQHHRLHESKIEHSDTIYVLGDIVGLYTHLLFQLQGMGAVALQDYWAAVVVQYPAFENFLSALENYSPSRRMEYFLMFTDLFFESNVYGVSSLDQELLVECHHHIAGAHSPDDETCDEE